MSISNLFRHLSLALLLAMVLPTAQAVDAVIVGDPLRITADTTLGQQLDRNQGATLFVQQYFSKYYTFLKLGSTVYSGFGNNPFIAVSQAQPNPFTIVTTVTAGDSVTVVHTLTYINGDEFFRHVWVITNNGQTSYPTATLLYGGDTYFAGDDRANGFFDTTLRMVKCTNSLYAGLMGLYGGPDSPATHYYEDQYGSVWSALDAGSLPDTVNSEFIDNGMALQWDRGPLAPGQSTTVTAYEKWTASGTTQVIAPTVANNSAPGQTADYTFRLQNLQTSPTTLTLSVSTDLGWITTLPNGSSVTLVPNSSQDVVVRVAIPANAAGSTAVVMLTATAAGGATISDFTRVTVVEATTAAAFTAATGAVAEGTAAAVLATVTLSLAPTATVSVPFTINGQSETSLPSSTYTLLTASPLTFAPGELTKTITANVVDNGTINSDRFITITLGTPTGAPLGAPSSTVVKVVDVDRPMRLLVDGAPPPEVLTVGAGSMHTFTLFQGRPPYVLPVIAGVRFIAGPLRYVDLDNDGVADPVQDVLVIAQQAVISMPIAFTDSAKPPATTPSVPFAATPLTGTAAVASPTVALSIPDAVYTPLCPSTDAGRANFLAAVTGKPDSELRAFVWDAQVQQYVQLPTMPTGGLQTNHGVFIASRSALSLDFSGTPAAFYDETRLYPGWNLRGIRPLSDGTTIVTSHAWDRLALFPTGTGVSQIEGAARSAAIGTGAYLWTGSAYQIATTLISGKAYWIKNNTAAELVLMRVPDTATNSGLSRALAEPSVASTLLATAAERGTPPTPPGAAAANVSSSNSGGCGFGSGFGVLLLGLSLAFWRWRRMDG